MKFYKLVKAEYNGTNYDLILQECNLSGELVGSPVVVLNNQNEHILFTSKYTPLEMRAFFGYVDEV